MTSRAQPQFQEALNSHLAGDLARAVALYRETIGLDPSHPEAHCNLSVALRDLGDLDQAIRAGRIAITLRDNYAVAHNNLANALTDQGHLEEAIDHYRRAIAIQSDYITARTNLGNTLRMLGRLDDAISILRETTSLAPADVTAHGHLATALQEQGNIKEALASYQRALQLNPNDAQIWSNAGAALQAGGQPDRAIEAYRHALTLNPNLAEAHTNLGNALKDQGLIQEAIESHRIALRLRPNFPDAHSNLLFCLHFDPHIDPLNLLEEHRRYDATHAQSLPRFTHENRARDPNNKIRIGYVSPDLRDHPVGRFLLPLFRHHDRTKFEIFSYSDAPRKPDPVTDQLRFLSSTWRDTLGLPHEKLAELIYSDRIDILVDLTLHSSGSALLTFARKPAPVQLTYLGYPGTTGLNAIDHRLTDNFLDPPGNDTFYTEHSIRLPSYWCYDPPSIAPIVSEPPALSSNFITFGCLNNFAKISPRCLATWSDLLLQVPNSRLLLYCLPGQHHQRVQQIFNDSGVDPTRIEFLPRQDFSSYFQTYSRIDIALDPFPYTGGTTTCDALYMGVPVITLAGKIAVHRAGVSILSQLNLKDLIAQDSDDYIRIASNLATDLPRLSSLRNTLRHHMTTSPLCDAPTFTRSLESAFLSILKPRQ